MTGIFGDINGGSLGSRALPNRNQFTKNSKAAKVVANRMFRP